MIGLSGSDESYIWCIVCVARKADQNILKTIYHSLLHQAYTMSWSTVGKKVAQAVAVDVLPGVLRKVGVPECVTNKLKYLPLAEVADSASELIQSKVTSCVTIVSPSPLLSMVQKWIRKQPNPKSILSRPNKLTAGDMEQMDNEEDPGDGSEDAMKISALKKVRYDPTNGNTFT